MTVGVSDLDATGAEGGLDGVGVHLKVCSDSSEGPALRAEVYRLVDLLVVEPAPANRPRRPRP